MGKLFCLMGKSSTGKDTIYKNLLARDDLALHTIIPCTTRPIRSGETHGVEYFFYTEEELARLEREGKIIELRSYDTVYGVWKYFTADDGQIDLASNSYLIIGTLESYVKMQAYFGREYLVPVYLAVDDGIRLERALARERSQKEPRYAEMCRRFLADEKDFSPEKLKSAGVTRIFENRELSETTEEIAAYIREFSS